MNHAAWSGYLGCVGGLAACPPVQSASTKWSGLSFEGMKMNGMMQLAYNETALEKQMLPLGVLQDLGDGLSVLSARSLGVRYVLRRPLI